MGGARAFIGGEELVADRDGRLEPGTVDPYWEIESGTAIDLEAPGFLKRETRVGPDRRITLWPVADERESQAVREMVYGPSTDVHEPRAHRSIWLSLDGAPAEVRDAWLAEALEFGRPFDLRYTPAAAFDDDDNALVVRFEPAAGGCVPDAGQGFCRESAAGREFSVLRARAGDPRTIRRVLAAWFLRANPRPGLLNPRTPDDDLSPLESQTIRMILQRPRPNRWPDGDR